MMYDLKLGAYIYEQYVVIWCITRYYNIKIDYISKGKFWSCFTIHTKKKSRLHLALSLMRTISGEISETIERRKSTIACKWIQYLTSRISSTEAFSKMKIKYKRYIFLHASSNHFFSYQPNSNLWNRTKQSKEICLLFKRALILIICSSAPF